MFFQTGVLKNFGKKDLCFSLFLNKVADLQTCNFIKKRFQHRSFPVNIVKLLRTPESTASELLREKQL